MNFCSLFVKVLSNSFGFDDFICKQYITSRNSSSIVEVDFGSEVYLYLCLLQLFVFVAVHVASLLSFKRTVLDMNSRVNSKRAQLSNLSHTVFVKDSVQMNENSKQKQAMQYRHSK